MMLDLVGDVFVYLIGLRRANSERPVSFLPRKNSNSVPVNPFRGTAFDLAHNFRKRMSSLESKQQVNMITWTTDRFGNCVHFLRNSAKISVQVLTPWIGNHSTTFFCAENNVIVQADVRH